MVRALKRGLQRALSGEKIKLPANITTMLHQISIYGAAASSGGAGLIFQ